jgi:hypothetical protein
MHFEGVNAKVRAMSARLLTRDDYWRIGQGAAIPAAASLTEDYARVRAYVYDIKLRGFLDTVFCADDATIKHHLRVWKKIGRLDKNNKKILTRIKGAEIYAYNQSNTHRLKTAYRLADTHVYAHLIPIAHHKQGYAMSRHYLARLYQRAARQHPDTLAVLLYYFYRKQVQINNLNTLREGLRYGWPAQKIMEYIRWS